MSTKFLTLFAVFGFAACEMAQPASVTCGPNAQGDWRDCLQSTINGATTIDLGIGQNYRIDSALSIPAGRTINGNGSRIYTDANTSLMLIAGANVTINTLWFDNRTTVSGLFVAIDIGAGVHDVRIQNGNYFTGRNNVAGVNINAPNIYNVSITGNTFEGTVYGVLTNCYAKFLHDLTVTNNTMVNLSGDGIEINSPVYGMKPPCGSGSPESQDLATKITISGNTIGAPGSTTSEKGFCVGIAGAKQVLIYNNNLLACKWHGIHIEDMASDITVVGNYIDHMVGFIEGDNLGWKYDTASIWVGHSQRVWLLKNALYNSINYGISLSYSLLPNDHNNDVAISENIINGVTNPYGGMGGYGIMVGGQLRDDVCMKTWVGPVPGWGGNTVSNAVAGAVTLTDKPRGVTITGNNFPNDATLPCL